MADNIANTTSKSVKAVNGSGIKYAGDLAGILTNLEENDLLFIDEIDLLPKVFSEYLEPALADFKLDIIIDEGPNARSVRLNLPRFTLIGTATNKKRLSPMLQACFTTDEELEGYSTAELADITRHDAKCLLLEIDQDATDLIVRSTNGTPSSVLNLIRHVRVFAKIKKTSQKITAEIATEALKLLESNERLEDAKQARQGIPSNVRREVWRRDGGKCVKCGSRENLEYDHIIPVSQGGGNTARNIELLCEACNRAKSNSIQ
jgi:Holliday junction DNA helicase RuvB